MKIRRSCRSTLIVLLWYASPTYKLAQKNQRSVEHQAFCNSTSMACIVSPPAYPTAKSQMVQPLDQVASQPYSTEHIHLKMIWQQSKRTEAGSRELHGLSSNFHTSSPAVSISPHKYQTCQRTMKKRRGSIAWWLVCLTAEQVSCCRPAQTCGWINSPCNICEGISI